MPPDGEGRVCYGRALDRASITSTSCEESWLPPPRPISALNICVTRAVPGSAMPRVWACRSEFRLSDQLPTYAFAELAIRRPTHPHVRCHSDPERRPRRIGAFELPKMTLGSNAEAETSRWRSRWGRPRWQSPQQRERSIAHGTRYRGIIRKAPRSSRRGAP